MESKSDQNQEAGVMNIRNKKIAVLVAIGLSASNIAHSDWVDRPRKTYGAFKEMPLSESIEMKPGPEKVKLNTRCEAELASSAFDFYVLKNSGKRVVFIADASGEGQNFFGSTYYVINQKCEPLGKKAEISYVADEPKGGYHMVSVLVNSEGDAIYFLAEAKLAPGKKCWSASRDSCTRQKGFTFSRELYKITDKGLVSVLNKRKTTDKDMDIDAVIPMDLN